MVTQKTTQWSQHVYVRWPGLLAFLRVLLHHLFRIALCSESTNILQELRRFDFCIQCTRNFKVFIFCMSFWFLAFPSQGCIRVHWNCLHFYFELCPLSDLFLRPIQESKRLKHVFPTGIAHQKWKGNSRKYKGTGTIVYFLDLWY